MGADEVTKLAELLAEKLGHDALISEVAGLKKTIEHIGEKVDRAVVKLDNHEDWGKRKHAENKELYVKQQDLKLMFAPYAIVQEVKEIKSKLNRTEYAGILLLISIVGFFVKYFFFN